MGAAQSFVSSEAAVAATATLVIAGAVGYGVTTMSQRESGVGDESSSLGTGTGGKSRKKKKKQGGRLQVDSSRSASEGGMVATVATTAGTTGPTAETVAVVPFPQIVPGDFDVSSSATGASSKGKPKDKGKGKVKQTAAGDDGASSATPSEGPSPAILASGSKSKKAKKKKKPTAAASSSNLASGSSSKVLAGASQSSSAVLEKEKERHAPESSAPVTGAGAKATGAKEGLNPAGSSSMGLEEHKKPSSGASTLKTQKKTTDLALAPVVPPASAPLGYVSAHDTDGSWTHVRRSGSNLDHSTASSHLTLASPSGISTAELTSDPGVASSMTDDGSPSSPVAERLEDTEDDEAQGEGLGSGSDYVRDATNTERRPLAERLLPKPRKTGVEDMLETPDHPTLARVVRVRPFPGEQPVSGFSWADYEDVHVDQGAGHDADGEDDAWGVVRSRRSKLDRTPSSTNASTVASKAPLEKTESGALSKRQRQNAKKREAAKAAKADGESQRLATLAKHKQQLEKTKMMEQISKSIGNSPSGGMNATVDDNGKLVWE